MRRFLFDQRETKPCQEYREWGRDAVRVFEKLGYRVIRESRHIVMGLGARRLVITEAHGNPGWDDGQNSQRCGVDTGTIPPTPLTKLAAKKQRPFLRLVLRMSRKTAKAPSKFVQFVADWFIDLWQ
jgi:hypothetical protein